MASAKVKVFLITVRFFREDMERYSALVEDLERCSYFLHFQEMEEEPRNMYN